jgi:hypothetical protein
MMTLLMQIEHARAHLRAMQQRLKEQERLIQELEDLRADCQHEWDEGVKGYEHEGRTCKLCGINELYAPTHKLMVDCRRY